MEFASKNLTVGQLNALVKMLGGEGVVRGILDGTTKFVLQMVSAFSRIVRVNRTQTPAQAIDATGRAKWYIEPQVLAEMPMQGREEDVVEFFELNYDPTVDQLDREYETRGLHPDPAATVQVMVDDPTFADERPVTVQWRDAQGRACCAVFSRDVGERGVLVDSRVSGWRRGCRFAGVRK